MHAAFREAEDQPSAYVRVYDTTNLRAETAEDILQFLESEHLWFHIFSRESENYHLLAARAEPYDGWRDVYSCLNEEGLGHWAAIKALVNGVRKYGTYKKYIRQPHRDVLTIHGLVQRGNLSTEEPVTKFLARFGNKFVVWRILQYWRDSEAD